LEQQAADLERSAPSRSRILQATISLYREIGYGKTTVADIARRCAMSPANVYRFFRSKRDIQDAVIAEVLEQVFQEASMVAGCSGSPLDRLEAVLRTISRLHEGRLSNDNRLHDLVAAATNSGWPVVLHHVDRIVGLLAPIISAGQVRGDIRNGSAETLGRCLLAAMKVHVSAREIRIAAARPNLDEMINFCVNSLCHAGCRTNRQPASQS
jgi:AcrR family transcriptional regulator